METDVRLFMLFCLTSFYQPRSGRSTVDVGQKRKKTLTLAFYCHFCLCPWNIFNWSHYMGVYGLAWTPAFIFETIWTPGPNFGSKGPLAPNLKIAIFSQNLSGPRKRPRLREFRTPNFRLPCVIKCHSRQREENSSPLPAVGLPVVDLLNNLFVYAYTYYIITVVIFWRLAVVCLQIPFDCETKYTL